MAWQGPDSHDFAEVDLPSRTTASVQRESISALPVATDPPLFSRSGPNDSQSSWAEQNPFLALWQFHYTEGLLHSLAQRGEVVRNIHFRTALDRQTDDARVSLRNWHWRAQRADRVS